MELQSYNLTKIVTICFFIALCCKGNLTFDLPSWFSADGVRVPKDVLERIATRQEKERPVSCSCGRENERAVYRIMGGKEVKPPHRYPWMAALLVTTTVTEFFCGGALINTQYVLTASHCLKKKINKRVDVALGIHDIKSYAELIDRAVRLIVHPQYDSKHFRNDIGLVKLENPVIYTRGIKPICLPSKIGMGLANDPVIVLGWGRKHPSGTLTRTLRSVDLNITDIADCNAKVDEQDVTIANICAGVKGKDSCQGDSGGPLIYKKNKKWYQVGVVSWGKSCGIENKPGVYVRVSYYLEWINSNVNDAPACVAQKGTFKD